MRSLGEGMKMLIWRWISDGFEVGVIMNSLRFCRHITTFDDVANDVAGLMGNFEDPENDKAFVARVVYAAINRNMLDLEALGLEKVGSYIWEIGRAHV